MQITISDEFPYSRYHEICELVGHDWEKGTARWTCRRCPKKRRARNRPGGR